MTQRHWRIDLTTHTVSFMDGHDVNKKTNGKHRLYNNALYLFFLFLYLHARCKALHGTLPIIDLMLVHHLRWWPNIRPTLS